ncbi:hypothetical protein OS493_003767 [Desmophyllum pertusum]|uniref:Uncharacterized protein n=1 Tax=Desmophyllum pertusum TaxID=174260 RepID=A0A9X0DBZ9_9CNID|nr:hypothetical protein OS493_003767 [Desmophyllum pertusum]
MAGKRESLERNTFQDANRAVSVEQNIGDSMQRVLDNSGNIHTDKNEVSLMASRNFKDEEVGNSNSTAQLSDTRITENYQHTHQSSPNRGNSGQPSQAHQIQGPVPRDENQNHPARPASQELIGIIPAREIDTRPPDSEGDGTQTYRRMAVCQETDDAQCQRRKCACT